MRLASAVMVASISGKSVNVFFTPLSSPFDTFF